MVERYDYPTIDFSVQGWDTLLNTLVEMLQDTIVTREVVTIGETIVPYEALYQKTSDSKWYKAKADGTMQPCQGIALESGDTSIPGTTDIIRIHRMGKLLDANGDPVDILVGATVGVPVYLDPDVAGALTQTLPADNAQIVGYALSATNMLVMIVPPNIGIQVFSRGGTVLLPTEAINVIVWRAPFACTVKAIKGYRVGGTGATINARRNGVDNHLSSALSLIDADTWMDGGAVQNTAYVIGDKLEIMIVTVADDPDQVAIQVDFSRP